MDICEIDNFPKTLNTTKKNIYIIMELGWLLEAGHTTYRCLKPSQDVLWDSIALPYAVLTGDLH